MNRFALAIALLVFQATSLSAMPRGTKQCESLLAIHSLPKKAGSLAILPQRFVIQTNKATAKVAIAELNQGNSVRIFDLTGSPGEFSLRNERIIVPSRKTGSPPAGGVTAMTLAPGGIEGRPDFISFGTDKGSVEIYNAISKRLFASASIPYPGSDSVIRALSFSQGSSGLAVGIADAVYFFNVIERHIQNRIFLPSAGTGSKKAEVTVLSFFPRGTQVFVGDSVGRLHICDVEKHQVLFTFADSANLSPVSSVAVAQAETGPRLLVTHKNGTAAIWGWREREILSRITLESAGEITRGVFCPGDPNCAITSHHDGVLRGWSLIEPRAVEKWSRGPLGETGKGNGRGAITDFILVSRKAGEAASAVHGIISVDVNGAVGSVLLP